MTKAGPRIAKGLKEAIRYAERDRPPAAYRAHVPEQLDVKAIRAKLGLTQQAFAARYGFSVNTLRHWEHGTRQPEGPTRAYLLVIDRAPDAVRKALRNA